MTQADVKKVVEIHLNAFKGVLTSLGSRFLTEFYSAVVEDPTGISLFAIDEQGIYGFAIGTIKPAQFYYRLIIKRTWKFFGATLPTIIRDPRILPHLLRGFLLPTIAAKPAGWGTLLFLAVAREGQNRGIGRLLITSFLDEGEQRGLKKINLLTYKYHNDAVNNFYRMEGFRVDHSFKTVEGRWMNEYVIDLPVSKDIS
jgi:GNAT superfamily N-acetyltransferase